MSFYKLLKPDHNLSLGTNDGNFEVSANTNWIAHFIEEGNLLAFIEILNVKSSFGFERTNKIIVTKIIELKDWEKWNDPIFCRQAVSTNGACLKYIPNQTKEMCSIAFRTSPHTWLYAKFVTLTMLIKYVKRFWVEDMVKKFLLQFTTEQWFRVFKIAVRNRASLSDLEIFRDMFSVEQWREFCVIVVRKNGENLQLIDIQDDELCFLAIKQSAKSIQHVKNLTPDFITKAIKISPLVVKFICGHIFG